MDTGINYFRLLWNLYRQKRNAGRTREQIGRLQKKKLEKLLLFACEYSLYYRKAFEAKGIFPENIRTTPLEKFPVLDQFCQTSKTSFEMLAEAEESAERVKVTEEIYRQVRKLLADKELEEIQFSIRFVEQIIPDKHTGKKPLIIKKMEVKRNDKNEHYRKAI